MRILGIRSNCAAVLIFSVFVFSGCARTRRISVLADRWETGQHKTCTFLLPENIDCDAPDAPVTHWEAEKIRNETTKSIVVERGEYNALFSSATSDYSVWDCHKTGNADVAIQCSASRRLSDDESRKFRDWDAAEKRYAETVAALEVEMESAKRDSDEAKKACDVRRDDFVRCWTSVSKNYLEFLNTIRKKEEAANESAKAVAASVGRNSVPN